MVFFIGNVFNVKALSERYRSLIENHFNIQPIFVEYWFFVRNMSNVALILSQYWHHIENVSKENSTRPQYCLNMSLHWLKIPCQCWHTIGKLSTPQY